MRLSFWSRASSQSTNAKIFRAAALIGLLSIIAKTGSTVKELIVAQVFGRGDALDAFLIAYVLPAFVLNLVMGSLGVALIPTFVETRQKGGLEEAQKLLSSLMVLSVVLATGIILLLGPLAPLYLPYLASGFSAAKLHLTQQLLYVLLPFILFNGIATCVTSVLNAGEKFVLPAITPLISPLVIILAVKLGAAKWGAFCLAGGTVAGSILEATLLGWTLKAQGMSLILKWHGLTPNIRSILGQYVPMLGGSFLLGSTTVVDQSMAAMLSRGSVAALGYATKVVSVACGVGAVALSTAAFPYLSKMAANDDWDGCRHTLKRYFLLTLLTTVPLTLGLMIFSKPLVRLLFQRGAFESTDTNLVSWVLLCYSLQIPFYVWNFLMVRFFSAIRRNDVLVYSAGISLVLDIILNLALMRVWGVAGIALSTSLIYAVGFVFLNLYSFRVLGHKRLSALPMIEEEPIIR